MSKILGRVIVVVMSLMVVGSAWADPAPLTFTDFSAKVLRYYPTLKSAHADVEIALAREMQARAGFWPSLNLSAGYKVTDDPVNVFGMLLRQERFTSADFDLKRLNTPTANQDISAGVYAEWPLFDALQTISRARSARAVAKAAESDEVFTRMEALLLAQDAYLNALTLERIGRILDDVQKGSEDDLQKAVSLKDKGLVLGADYYAARVMAGDFSRMKNEVLRQKKAMQALLNILMGEPIGREWTLPAMVQEGAWTSEDLSGLWEAAGNHRPDLLAMESRMKAAEAELVREKATALPALKAFGEATNDREKFQSPGGSNYTVGLKAEMPLFDPSRAGRIREARARKDRLEQNIQLFRDRIKKDLVEEFSRHEALRDNMPILKGMSEDAKKAVDLTVPLYREGRKSIADLMSMRRSRLQSVQAYDRAVTGLWMSEARLLFLKGELNDETMTDLLQRSGL